MLQYTKGIHYDNFENLRNNLAYVFKILYILALVCCAVARGTTRVGRNGIS
jgi:hypothetical protein